MRVEQNTIELGGSPVLYRSARAAGTPRLYLHGVPTSSTDWLPFLERGGGLAPDLIGFGRSGKGGHLDYTLAGLAAFVDSLLGELGVEALDVVGHDWGAVVGLVFAQRRPVRVRRLVLINAQPAFTTEHFQPSGLANLWRRPVVGELTMGAINRRLLARELRKGGPWTDEGIAAVWHDFDQGTQRAILRLYRSTNAAALGRVSAGLDALTLPALVVWGEQDPWLPAQLASDYVTRLPQATLVSRPNAGHWPWLDDPEVVERVMAFLDP